MVLENSELPDSMAVNVPGYIQRTTTDSYLRIAWGYLPENSRCLWTG